MNKFLGVLMEVKQGLPDADFYIKRKGSTDTIGEPTFDYNKEYFGVKVNRAVLVPKYMYYCCMHFHQRGMFKRHSKGTLALQHIRLEDVKTVLLEGLISIWK